MTMYLRLLASHSRLSTFVVASFLLVLLEPRLPQAADVCLPLLALTGHDVTWVELDDTVERSSKSAFCDDRFLKREKESSFGLNVIVPIEGVPFNFGVDSTSGSALEARRKFCASSEKFFAEAFSLTFVQSIATRESMSAFLQCRKIEVASENSVNLTVTNVRDDIVLAEANFTKRYAGQPYPTVTGLFFKGIGDCVGQLEVGAQLVETKKKSFCTREGEGDAILMLATEFETVHALLPGQGRAGECSLWHSIPIEDWVDSGECREGHALTPQLHNEPERAFDIVVTAAPPDEKIGPECRSLICRPRSGFENGCAFGRKVGENIGTYTATTNLMVGSHPQQWTRGFRVIKRVITYDNEEQPGEIVLKYGRSFSVEVPEGIGVTARCTIAGNSISFDPLTLPTSLERLLEPIGIPVKGPGKTTVTYLVKQ